MHLKFEDGDIVQIKGLLTNTILNDMEGIVLRSSSNKANVLIGSKDLSINVCNLVKVDNPISNCLRLTLHQNNLKRFLERKIKREYDICTTTVNTEKVFVSTGTITDFEDTAPPEEPEKSVEISKDESETKVNDVEVAANEEKGKSKIIESSLFSGKREGLFRTTKRANGLFGKDSKMSSLLAKMNQLGAVDTPNIAQTVPHIPTAPDLNKIFGIKGEGGGETENEKKEKGIKEAKEGMSAMLDISVDDILAKVEELREGATANNPKLIAMLTVVDMIKEKRG